MRASLIFRSGRSPLEKGMITHSSFPAWRIPRTEEPGRQPWDHKELDMIEQLILSNCHKVTAQKGTVGCLHTVSVQFSSVQSLSHVWLFAIPWIAARQASLSITNTRSSLRLKSIESVMPSSHLILCHPLLLLPPIPPSIRVFSNESTLLMRWPKY